MKKRLAGLMRWHRYAGLLVAPILLMLTVSGLLINHLETFSWSSKPVYSSWVGHLYGIPKAEVTTGFGLSLADNQGDTAWIAQLNTQVFFDEKTLSSCEHNLAGAVFWQAQLALLCGDHLQLLTEQGELIEELSNLPAGAAALSVVEGRLILKTTGDDFFFDENSGEWSPFVNSKIGTNEQGGAILWSRAIALPVDLARQLNRQQAIPGLTWERVLLDFHSGRLFGRVGVWLVDAAAVFMLFLALSGSATWLARKHIKKNRKKGRKQHRKKLDTVE